MNASILAGATLVAILFGGNVVVEPPLKSGPQVGERNNRGAFYPQLVTGPGAGERRCPV